MKIILGITTLVLLATNISTALKNTQMQVEINILKQERNTYEYQFKLCKRLLK